MLTLVGERSTAVGSISMVGARSAPRALWSRSRPTSRTSAAMFCLHRLKATPPVRHSPRASRCSRWPLPRSRRRSLPQRSYRPSASLYGGRLRVPLAGQPPGRGRSRPDGSQRPARPPRCLLVSTGEELPRGASIMARLIAIEVAHSDVDLARLTSAQSNASSGLYAQSMAFWVQCLARDPANARATPPIPTQPPAPARHRRAPPDPRDHRRLGCGDVDVH